MAVRGPIDIYNEVFLTTLTDGGVVRQLRVEIIDDKEIEIPVLAGRVAFDGGSDEEGILVFTASASAPDEAWLRVAGQATRGWCLANANDIDSLRSTRLDLEFVRGLGLGPSSSAPTCPWRTRSSAPRRSRGSSAWAPGSRSFPSICATVSLSSPS